MTPVLDETRKPANPFVAVRHLMIMGSALFFVLLVSTLLLVCQNAGLIRERLFHEFNKQQLLLARQVAARIQAHLLDIEMEMKSLKRLNAGAPGRDVLIEAMHGVVQRTRSKGLMEIGLMNSEGQIVEVHDIGVTETVTQRQIASDCTWDESGGMVLGPLKVAAHTPKESTITSMLCTRISFDEYPVGVMFAWLDVSRLVKSVTGEIRSAKTGYAWVADETGLFLYYPTQDSVGKDALAAEKEQRPYINVDQGNRIIKEQMLRGEEGTGTYVSGWHRGIQGEMTKLIAFTPVRSAALSSGQVWSVAVVAPTSEVAESVRRIHTRPLAAAGTLIAGMCVVGCMAIVYHRRHVQTLKAQEKQSKATPHDKKRGK